jgi:hypothetical protein
LVALLVAASTGFSPVSDLLTLHPGNPHYFQFRGRPTVLITSGEHYGALINLDFDYRKYLETLSRDGLNLTRVFSGAYVEPQGAFKIAKNTLAPAAGRFLAPWERSGTPGYAGGGNKFDLNRFSAAYFERLRDLMTEASNRGVVVELNLFCPFYGEEQWNLSPMNERNNVNGIGAAARTDVYTLDRSGPLLAVQKKLVQRIVQELAPFDNLYYEICNEPYFGGVTLDWQYAIAREIREAEAGLDRQHLISRNVANAGLEAVARGAGKVWKEDPLISILNFHYSNPPLVVPLNYSLDRVLGENETGFHGTGDDYYRREAWEFILAGGGLFNNLDYSFVAGQEDGTFQYPESQPGGGSPALRKQLGTLKQFAESFDFVRMQPTNTVIRGGIPEKGRAQVLAEEGRQYAIYLRGDEKPALKLDLPAGEYRAEWLNPVTGDWSETLTIRATGLEVSVSPESYPGEIALRVRSRR